MKSFKYTLNREDVIKILQTVGWSMAAAAFTGLIALWQAVELPSEWLFIGPMINSALYAGLKFVQGR